MEDKDYENLHRERYFTYYDDIGIMVPEENDDGYLSVAEHLKATSDCWYVRTTLKFGWRHILEPNLFETIFRISFWSNNMD